MDAEKPMAISKRRAVTVLLTEEHLRKMIENHLLTENEVGDRSRSLASCKSYWTLAWDFRTGLGTIGMNG